MSFAIFASSLAFGTSGELLAEPSPDRVEPGSVEAIAAATTSEEYLPSSVSYLPDSDVVPSPVDHLGRIVGAERELTHTEEIHRYFRALEATSDRILIESLGFSEGGREMIVAKISSAENLAQIAKHRDAARALADPRTLDDAEALETIEVTVPSYYLLGGLHSTETGPPEMLMELAYRLIVSEREEIEAIRENLIVLITPVVEPDGRERVVDWYYRHLRDRDGDYYEKAELRSPPYWGHYAFHDNNRDGMQQALALTRAVHSAYFDHRPLVVHDLHESLPLLYISTGHGPYSEAVDPVTINEWSQMAHHEASELQAEGLPGVWVWGFWDGWWPGYLFSVAMNHNATGRFYETFGNSMAGTFTRELDERKFLGKSVTSEQWYRPWPPDSTVVWSMRNNTNYMQAGVLEALEYAADHRKELLRNFWIKSVRSLEKGRTEAPYAWIFDETQRDPERLAHLIERLRSKEIEVHRLTSAATVADSTYPAGSYVVRMDQPHRNAAVNFLDVQRFPEEETNRPYDDVAWTFPLLFGVEGARIDDREILDAEMDLLDAPVRVQGRLVGSGDFFLIADQGQNALFRARFLLERRKVEVAETSFSVDGHDYPAGSWIFRAPEEEVRSLISRCGLEIHRTDRRPEVPVHEIGVPKIAVLHTWTATQDCGWVRYTLDQNQIPHELINPDHLKKGKPKHDVILFPTRSSSFQRMLNGIDPKHGPLAYTKTARYPSHGIPDESDDITGGIGYRGMENLRKYLEDGGVLVTLGNGGILPVEGGLVRKVRSVPRSSFYTPGSEVVAHVEKPGHPLTYGFEEWPSVFRGNYALFDVARKDRDRIVLQFGTKSVRRPSAPGADPAPAAKAATPSERPDSILLSGLLPDPGAIDGKPAILDLPVGKGRVVLFGFNPMHRYLNHSDFRWVYNALLNWDDFPD